MMWASICFQQKITFSAYSTCFCLTSRSIVDQDPGSWPDLKEAEPSVLWLYILCFVLDIDNE